MKRIDLLTVLFLFFGTLQMSSGYVVSAEDKSNWIGRNAYSYRMIYDMGTFDFGFVIYQSSSTWVLAEIKPSSNNGRLQGAVIDPQTGFYVPVLGVPPGKIIDGTIEVVTSLAKKPQKQIFPYKWIKSVNIFENMIGTVMNDEYLPFWSDNLILCDLITNAPDRNPVEVGSAFSLFGHYTGSVHLVPKEWKNFVVPAYEYFRDNKNLFEDDKVSENKEQLKALLKGENPLLAITACRILSRGGALDQPQIEELLRNSSGIKQAVLTFALFTNIPSDSVFGDFTRRLNDEELADALLKAGMSKDELPEPGEARKIAREYLAERQVPQALNTLVQATSAVLNAASNSAQVENIALGLGRSRLVSLRSDVGEGRDETKKQISNLLLSLRSKLSLWGKKTDSDKGLDSLLIDTLGAEKPQQN